MSVDTGHPQDTLDSYVGSDGMVHRRLRLGDDDKTPTVRSYPPAERTREYHSRCFGCWQGTAHSEAYHDKHAVGPRFTA